MMTMRMDTTHICFSAHASPHFSAYLVQQLQQWRAQQPPQDEQHDLTPRPQHARPAQSASATDLHPFPVPRMHAADPRPHESPHRTTGSHAGPSHDSQRLLDTQAVQQPSPASSSLYGTPQHGQLSQSMCLCQWYLIVWPHNNRLTL